MKLNSIFPHSLGIRSWACGVVVVVSGASVATATPYATCLTNGGDGTISFRLNQTTGTNDLVQVISG